MTTNKFQAGAGQTASSAASSDMLRSTTPKTARHGLIRQRAAFAFGNLGQAAFYNAMSTFFMTYVTTALFARTDKAVAARMIALITGLVVAIRIAEIFLDPILGNIVDNTRTKWGRFRVWQFIGGIVPSVLLVVVFTGLFGLVNVNTTWFITLFIVTFILLDVFYSARDISYWGMIPALSSDSHERSVYTSLGTLTGSLGYNGITVVVIPIVSYFTFKFTGEQGEGQPGWTAFAIIVALLGLITAWTVAFGTRESSSELRKQDSHCGPLDAFKAIAHNDQLLWTALSYLLYAIANVATTGVLFYQFTYVLGMPQRFAIAGVIPVITGLVTTPLYPLLNRVIPRRWLFAGGMGLMILGYALFIAAPRNLSVVLVALILFYLPAQTIHSHDDRFDRIRTAQNRAAQRGGDAERATDARQDRRRLLERHRRLRRSGCWHGGIGFRRGYDECEHPYVHHLGVHCAVRRHCAQPDRVPAHGAHRREAPCADCSRARDAAC